MADYGPRERDLSRPTTPTGSTRTYKAAGGMRALDTTKQPGTFFDDATPVDNRRSGGTDHDPLRDSHDLSFGDGTRDSVVDNMLLSLDQFPVQFSQPPTSAPNFSDPFFIADNHYPPPNALRQRGHTYTSSQSSDYDLHIDETASRYSSHHSRSRRSNSSNNIPNVVSRNASLRGPWTGSKQNSGVLGEYQQTRHARGTGKQGSKGSGSSSMDFGHAGILNTHRLGLGNRSASFDHGNVTGRSSPVKTESLLDRSRPAYQNYQHEYDAAPQPTIPAGPRRAVQETLQPSPAYPPQPTYAPPQTPAPRRKGSVRSTSSYRTLRKNKSQPEPNMRLQAQEFVNASTLRDLPSLPRFPDPPAPSPTVATRKHATSAIPSPAPAPKEKQGFFRRVFGGGLPKSTPQLSNSSVNSNASRMESPPATSLHQASDLDSPYSQTRPRTTPNSSNHISSQIKPSRSRGPQTAASMQNLNEQPPPPPALTKKHSSFFRRRKKSVSEAAKPPTVPVEFRTPQKAEILPPAQASPGVSSLRKVMNPYLHDLGPTADSQPNSNAGEVFDERPTNERSKGFSPGYMPHKDATVRAIKPGSRGDDMTPPSSRGDQLKTTYGISADSPKLKLKMKKPGRPNLSDTQEDSFLADSSSCNEDRSGRVTPAAEYNATGSYETRRRKASPASSLLRDRNVNAGDKSAELLTAKPSDARAAATGQASQSASEVEDDGWVLTTPTPKEQAVKSKTERVWLDQTSPDAKSGNKSGGRSRRVWLEPTSSEERLAEDDVEELGLPMEGARASQKPLEKESPASVPATTPSSENDVFHSATSLPTVQVDGRDTDNMPAIIESRHQHEEPTDSDRERALRMYSGDESAVQKSQAATILGDVTLTGTRVRKAFMDLFNWTGYSILAAMRDMCGKLVLKAETQQVDRILMSLSERWCECNPKHGFKAIDVVHTICYSILLLNTDLHVADIESRMTRSQFVKNTLPTVVRVCHDAVKDAADETLRPQSTQFRRGSLPWNDKSEPSSPTAENATFPTETTEEPLENRRARSRLSIRPPHRTGSEGTTEDNKADSNLLINAPFNGSMRAWELQIEAVLKDFYDSIRKQRLPLHGAPTLLHEQPSTNNLSVSGMLRRTPSVLSKAPSDSQSYRGRNHSDFRSKTWNAKARSRPRLYPSSTVGSSRTSLDDQSVWSPAGSSTWSRYSHGKTQTSMSMESLGSHFAHGDYQQAIGFANALSQAIIREEGMTIASEEEFTRVAPLLEDETLELAGAPWAKEGILKHKHHLEALDKKAKDRTWGECFAVIEKGYMRLFSFNMNSKSMRNKNKSRPSTGGVVGGGNWMDNAEALDSFLLRQTIASALPPPGYSKSRPHVWALSLPTGAVHLFQVGTPDIVREFVSTANYWSARLSKEPLMGGVSNIEYGWGENVINTALIRPGSNPSNHGHVSRPSMASSLRSSMDHATGTMKARLPGDKANLSDWSPPTQSMMASNLMEVDQLRALSDYVKQVEEELSRHNELRAPMLIAFSPRHPNAAKSMANWERKSSYLLREIVKFRTYIDSLTASQTLKEKLYAEREANEEEEGEGGMVQASPAREVDGASEAPTASKPIAS